MNATVPMPLSPAASQAFYACPLALAEQVASCGGKARNLARLIRLGQPVPPGLVVPDRSLQKFLDVNDLHARTRGALESVDFHNPDSLRQAALDIRERFLRGTIPDVVCDAIHDLLPGVLSGTTLIVRSSAVGEDAEHASFAGQLDSILHVNSDQGLHDALRACWASCWSARSLFYQLSRGVRLHGMGVVIQEQVISSVSGVLFTRGPEAADKGSLIVEYCLGYGDALVSGQTNPGRIVISRDGRFTHVALPEHGGKEAVLSDAHLHTLTRAGLLLEKALGGAQDIEWTIDEDGRLYLVQSRPITTGVSKPSPTSQSAAARVVWSNANVNENFPEPISPLLYSIAADGYYHYFRNLGLTMGIDPARVAAMEYRLRHLIGVHGARMYYNLGNIHAVLREAPFGARLCEFFDSFVGTANADRQSTTLGRPSWMVRCRTFLGRARMVWRGTRQLLFASSGVAAFENEVAQYAEETTPEALADCSLRELLDYFRGFLHIRFHRWLNASLADAGAMVSYGALKSVLGREFPADDLSALHNSLLKGLGNVVSSEPAARLWDLSRTIRNDKDLAQLFATAPPKQVISAIRTQPTFAGFRTPWEAFLKQWGFRCSGELMLTVASLQEAPERLVEILKAYVRLEGDSPSDVLRRQEAERTAQSKRVLKVLRGRKVVPLVPWPTRATLVKFLLGWTRRAIALRERARLKQALLYNRCRRIAQAIGERLAILGTLERRDDVFFLTYQEIEELLAGCAMFPDQVRELVRLRKTGHRSLSTMALPDAFELDEGAYRSGSHTPPIPADAPVTEMSGVAACGGQATGPAAVLTDCTEFGKLQRGDILVARQTDPGWGPAFFLIKGLIMERGGMLSHGAILAREYGLPTVVGVKDATRRIAQGRILSVNGDRGVVHFG